MTVEEVKCLLALVEIQVKITLCEDNDEECGDLYEELDFLVTRLLNYNKNVHDENKENLDVATNSVEVLE